MAHGTCTNLGSQFGKLMWKLQREAEAEVEVGVTSGKMNEVDVEATLGA